MKKYLTTLNLIIFIAIFSTPFVGVESFAIEGPKSPIQTKVPKQNTSVQSPREQNMPKVLEPATIPEKNAYELTHVGKTGFKYGLLKFFLAMLGVLVSSGAIFLGLKFYKKFVLKNNAKLDDIDYDKTLESPKDFKEAINLFLDKTDKQ